MLQSLLCNKARSKDFLDVAFEEFGSSYKRIAAIFPSSDVFGIIVDRRLW